VRYKYVDNKTKPGGFVNYSPKRGAILAVLEEFGQAKIL
jgi:hypothetical protein